ncbi:MAG: PPK2 family polyphosphate kinase [Chthoniobacterales bacterium]
MSETISSAAAETTTAFGGIVSLSADTNVHLAEIDPAGRPELSKRKAERRTDKLCARLAELQSALYAEHQRSLIIVVQAMDTGGKDGAIKKICSGLDPNGIHLTNFKVPSLEEWDHDFLWRVHQAAPRKGVIAIWNRSHYEDVLVPKVHGQISDAVWHDRCADINAFEKLLAHNGAVWLKFFLHISKDEQKARLESRLQEAHKLWKFNPGDLKERALWEKYQQAYEGVFDACSNEIAPWHIVPANRKWARNLMIMETIVTTLEAMNPQYPAADFDPGEMVVE